MKSIKLHITRELIKQAIPENSHRCMIAQALRTQHGAWSIDVTADSIRFNIEQTRYMCATPAIAAVELVKFDTDPKSVRPFDISLRKLYSMPVVRRGPRKRLNRPAVHVKHPRKTIRRYHGLKIIKEKG